MCPKVCHGATSAEVLLTEKLCSCLQGQEYVELASGDYLHMYLLNMISDRKYEIFFWTFQHVFIRATLRKTIQLLKNPNGVSREIVK